MAYLKTFGRWVPVSLTSFINGDVSFNSVYTDKCFHVVLKRGRLVPSRNLEVKKNCKITVVLIPHRGISSYFPDALFSKHFGRSSFEYS